MLKLKTCWKFLLHNYKLRSNYRNMQTPWKRKTNRNYKKQVIQNQKIIKVAFSKVYLGIIKVFFCFFANITVIARMNLQTSIWDLLSDDKNNFLKKIFEWKCKCHKVFLIIQIFIQYLACWGRGFLKERIC